MRKVLLAAISAAILGVCVYLQADAPKKEDTAKLTVQLVDSETGQAVAGIIRVFRVGEDKPLVLPGLYDRLRGLKLTETLKTWYVLPATGATLELPRGKIRIEAVSGLETLTARQELDLSQEPPAKLALKLKTIFRPEQTDLVAGNTHLHLMKLTRDDAEDYLKQIPAADRLKVLFISYLERVKDDAEYITNKYPLGDLKQFDSTGVLVNNGEEHRHNFQGYGQGYGHVMFLNIKELVKPVSIGPGIMGVGNDDLSLSPGIQNARKQGGTIIWCHNTSGHEDIPNALAGRIDALNVFDGSRGGTFEDGYYHYLNIGMRLPISTGTDWFMYDFSRVYAKVPGNLTRERWLEAVRAGRCQATNSPVLTMTVDGKEIGDVINLDKPKTVRVEITATGRHDFQKLQLVQNGKVIQTEIANVKEGVWSARFVREVRLEEPAWFTARIDADTKNELDKQLFAHTSPIYVDFGEKRVFEIDSAQKMQRQMEEALGEIRARGKYTSDGARDKILAIYEETAKDLAKRINQRGK